MALTKIPANMLSGVDLGDSVRVNLGTDNDLALFHTGGNGVIHNTTGELRIRANNLKLQDYTNEDLMIVATSDGSVDLYHNNQKKFETSATGASVTGNLAVSGNLTVSGTTTELDTTNLNVTDKNITLNYHASSDTSSNADGAGITIQDAVNGSTDATISWVASSDEFAFSHPASIVNAVGGDTVLNLTGTYGSGNNVALLGFARSGGAVAGDIRYTDATTDMEIGTSTAHGFSLKTTNTKRLTVASGGNVGIGNTAPAATLEVGTLSSGSTGNVIINSEGGNPPALQVKSRTNRARINIQDNDTSGYIIAEGSVISIGFADAVNDNNININSSHDVGIGTDTPSAKLHIQDNTSTVYDATGYQHDLFIEKRNTAGNNQVGSIRFGITGHDGSTTGEASIGVLQTSNAHSGNIVFGTRHSGTRAERMRISSDGKVGIGTTSPAAPLDVKFVDNTNAQRWSYGSSEDNFYLELDTAIPGGGIVTYNFNTKTNGTLYNNNLVLDRGNVAIGTSSPTAKLTITDEDAGQAMVQVRNYSTGATGSFGNAHSAEFRSATSTTTHGMLIHHNENNIDRRTLDVADSTGVFASFVQGKLGIGTTSPSAAVPLTAYYSATSQFHVGGAQAGISNNVYYNGSAYTNRNTSAGGALLQIATDGSFAFRRATSGSSPTLTYSMYIDANGNVGIGETNPTKLGLTGSSTGKVLHLGGDDCQLRLTYTVLHHDHSGNTTTHLRNHYGATDSLARMKLESGYISFCTGTTFDEKMRLKGSTLYVSTDIGAHSGGSINGNSYAHNTYAHAGVFGANSTPDGTLVVEDYDVSSGIGNTVLKCYLRDQDPATSATFIDFADGGGRVGSVTHNDDGGGVSFNTTSDYRLKENVNYTWDATTLLKQLKPAKFNFKTNPAKTVQGMLAHEVMDIVPSSVRGDKDHMEPIGTIKDSDDNIVYEGVYEHFCKTDQGQTWEQTGTEPLYQELDYSRLVPLLVKTIQELEARIATLEG